MENKLILLIIILSSSLTDVYSQRNQSALELDALDRSYFKWKEFSFNQPWEKIKKTCDVEQIETYRDEYQYYYCGDISDTSKSYIINNKTYHEFNNIWFDQVVIHIIGSTTSKFNYSSIYFIKQFADSTKATLQYAEVLQSIKNKYGDRIPRYLEKYKKGPSDSIVTTPTYSHLNNYNPFSADYETIWIGKNNISLKLSFIKESNLIILSVVENPLNSLYNKSRNWFTESNYEEKFTDAFKEFDKKNGYKGLRFGILKSAAKNIVKYKEANVMKEYLVTTQEYKNWFYIPFDFCNLKFNKKSQLYDVTLSKDNFSDHDYEQFIKELIELFGLPNSYKEKNEDLELSLWKGKNIYLFILRPQEKGLYVDFYCVGLDDTSPTDKIY